MSVNIKTLNSSWQRHFYRQGNQSLEKLIMLPQSHSYQVAEIGFGSGTNLKFLFHLLWHTAFYYVYPTHPRKMKGSGPRGSGWYSHRKEKCASKAQHESDLNPAGIFPSGCDYFVESTGYIFFPSLFLKMCFPLLKNNEESTKLSMVEIHSEMLSRE